MNKDGQKDDNQGSELSDLKDVDLEIGEGEEELTLRVIEDKPRSEKVIDPPEKEVEEKVLRLDQKATAETHPPKKVEARKDRAFLNTMLAEEATDYIDPENPTAQWIREVPQSKARAVPMGWFVLLIVVFGGVLLWAGVQIWISGDKPVPGRVGEQTDLASNRTGQADFINPEDEAQQREKAEIRFLLMERTINEYLSADTLEKKLNNVRHRKRVEPLMRDYYSRAEMRTRDYKAVSEYHIVSLDNHPFIAVRVDLEGDDSVALLLEEVDGEFKIDWESEVAHQEIPIQTFIEERPEGSVDFRVYVTSDHFYAYEFRDEQKWQCYKLTGRDSEESLFGYVERGSLLEKEIKKSIGWDPRKKSHMAPLFLRVSFPPAGRGSRSVRIEEVISNRWAYSTNPEKD
ncbi:MAG: hypothetical protein ACON5H_01420 [Akkermansiaceae bacterium]